MVFMYIGKYTSPMDAMGGIHSLANLFQKSPEASGVDEATRSLEAKLELWCICAFKI